MADGLASLARLLADRTRATVCTMLLDGRAWTSGELARAAGVAAPTMSEHLNRLVDGGLLCEVRQGRHRYVRLAGPHVAAALEQLMVLTEPQPSARSLRAVAASEALRRGRTCYDHLAGHLGVSLCRAMVDRGVLDGDLAITPDGRAWFAESLGTELPHGARPLTRACLDWTERRFHLGGAAGRVLHTACRERGWIEPVGTGRAVRATAIGERSLDELLGVGDSLGDQSSIA